MRIRPSLAPWAVGGAASWRAAAVGGAASWGAAAVGAAVVRLRAPRPDDCAARSRGSPSVKRCSFRGRGGCVGQNACSAMWVVGLDPTAWIVWTRCFNAP